MDVSTLLPLLARFSPLAGLVAVLTMVWMVGPTLAFGEMRPLAEAWQRWLATALFVLVFAVWYVVKWLLAKQQAQKLESAVAGQEQGARVMESRLQAGFEALKKRLSTTAILEMPWYAVVGAPGTGKTTAVRASNLRFVARDIVGAEAYKGVGGTRNCNWWIAEEAVLLDTAGRYSYSEAPSATDDEEWKKFLAMVKKFRPERPVNGAVVFFGLDQLASMSDAEFGEMTGSVSARVRELSTSLGLALPVYAVFTKLDRIAGFSALLEDMSDAECRKSLGVALDTANNPVSVKELAEQGLAGLVRKLELWIHGEVQREHNLSRTAQMIAAPTQLLSLVPRIVSTLERLAIDGGEGRGFHLRGTYLLSSVQEGSLFDRIAKNLSGAFGLSESQQMQGEHKSRPVFVEGVFRDAMLPEARLAGMDLGAVRRDVRRRLVLAMSCMLIGLLAATMLSISFVTNRSLVRDTDVAAQHYVDVAKNSASGSQLSALLDRLEALNAAIAKASRYQPAPPFGAREFLYQGRMLSGNAGDIYDRELAAIVGRQLRSSLEAGLRASDANSLPLQFEWLKAYLMLDQENVKRRDSEFLSKIANTLWSREFAASPSTKDRLSTQLRIMLERGMHSQTLDAQLVESIRQRVAGGGNPALAAFVYRSVELHLALPDAHDLSLGSLIGVDGLKLFKFAPNWSESSKIPALYTRPGAAAFSAALNRQLGQFADDGWVLDKYMPPRDVVMGDAIRNEVRKHYAQQYVRTWESVLQAVSIPPTGAGDVRSKLALASAYGTSPVSIYLQAVLPHIDLPIAVANSLSAAPVATDKSGTVGTGEDSASDPRKLVNDHFKRLASAIRGDGAPSLNDFMSQTQGAAATLNALQMSTGAGSQGMDPMRAAAMSQMISASQGSNAFPPPLNAWHVALMGGAMRSTQAIVTQGAASELRAQTSGACGTDVSALYPFANASTADISPAQFAELFAANGSLETFFKSKLADAVDTRTTPWRFKASSAVAGTLSSSALAQFERARRIREAFFSGGGDRIQIEFALTPIEMSKNAKRLMIRIGQDTFEFSHGPLRRKTMTWAANGDIGIPIEVEFDDIVNGAPAVHSTEGTWSLLRWLDQNDAKIRSDGKGLSLRLKEEGGYAATVQFESHKLESLLVDTDWRSLNRPGNIGGRLV